MDENKPLKNVRIIELGTHVAVPNSTRILADWGADVIKVEHPTGDEWRKVGMNQMCSIDDEENPFFTLQNANKKFISVDLKKSEGREVMYRLLETADAFVTNLRLASLKRLGMDYDSLVGKVPDIIYGHFSGYGDKGPDAGKPGFDSVAFWARSGAMADWGARGTRPFIPPIGAGDTMMASIICSGLLAALFAKKTTGKGTFLSSSLLSGGAWYNGSALISTQYGYSFPIEADQPNNPFGYQYQCRDGEWLMIAVMDYNGRYPEVCRTIGREDLVQDDRFNSIVRVREHISTFVKILGDVFRTKDSAEWLELFTAADIVCGKLGHLSDLHRDPQIEANGYVEHVQFGSGNEVVMPVVPVSFSAYDSPSCKPSGKIGRDTDEVLRGAGFDDEEISEMRRSGAVS